MRALNLLTSLLLLGVTSASVAGPLPHGIAFMDVAIVPMDRGRSSKPAPLRLPLSAILALERDEASAGRTDNAVGLLMFAIDLYSASWRAYAGWATSTKSAAIWLTPWRPEKKSLEIDPKYDNLIAKINGAAKPH